jgi:hypothetical protein
LAKALEMWENHVNFMPNKTLNIFMLF